MTKVVFFGNERLISGLEKTDAPILKGLIEQGYDVVAVVSHHSNSMSRNQRSLEVAEIAKQYSIPVLLPHRPSEIIEDLKALQADIAVLAAYGRIISQSVIDVFPLGIINIHPSLLPKYRGPTPIESAILNGDSQTGVSIMQLTAGMDEGPVYTQQTLSIEKYQKKFDLYARIVDVSTDLFFTSFPLIIDGTLKPTPQDDPATYSNLIKKSDAVIDWNKDANILEREIRAYESWPQSKTSLGSVDIIITSAHTNDASTGVAGQVHIDGDGDSQQLMVSTGNGSLCIDMLKPLSKKEMPIQAFLAGYRSKLDV